jgi:hypothetical protein
MCQRRIAVRVPSSSRRMVHRLGDLRLLIDHSGTRQAALFLNLNSVAKWHQHCRDFATIPNATADFDGKLSTLSPQEPRYYAASPAWPIVNPGSTKPRSTNQDRLDATAAASSTNA